VSWLRRLWDQRLAVGLALLGFLAWLSLLVRHGAMFYWGSDLVANAAYGITAFNGVLSAGWAVPKPAEMLIFGAAWAVTGGLWSLHLVLMAASAATIWAGCRLIGRHYGGTHAALIFGLLMIAMPPVFRASVLGGACVLSTCFLLLAVVAAAAPECRGARGLLLVSLSLANLARPDSWPGTYLIIFLLLLPRLRREGWRAWRRSDLWFLVPAAMPLAWVGVGWAVFGDPLYSMNIARAFVAEVSRPEIADTWAGIGRIEGYLMRLRRAYFDYATLGSWVSVRSIVILGLLLFGLAVMIRRDRRRTVLAASPVAGSLFFYLVYALRGSYFRVEYLYAIFVFALLSVAVGLGSLCRLAGGWAPPAWRRPLGLALAVAVLVLLVANPVRLRTLAETLPTAREWAAHDARARPVIECLAREVRGSPSARPVILTSAWVPPSRIALRLRSGREIHLMERLIARGARGDADSLPALAGRTAYLCGSERMSRELRRLVESLTARAKEGELVCRHENIVVLKCRY
jgi:hypothetical protein